MTTDTPTQEHSQPTRRSPHAMDTLTDSGLGQEVRAAVKWLNDLSDEAGKRGLIFRVARDPRIILNDDGSERGPYVEAIIVREIK